MPSIMEAVSIGRWRIIQDFGFASAISMALSRSGLYETIRLTSMPQEAETITFGLASLMRVASSFAAKPPKTTEWTAPRRAQASMAMAASGIIGMYMITLSPFCTPWKARTPANFATSSLSCRYVNFLIVSVTGLSYIMASWSPMPFSTWKSRAL